MPFLTTRNNVSIHARVEQNTKIAAVGSGYVGLVAAVRFAGNGLRRHLCLLNDERGEVTALQGGNSLIHEHYLPELLEKYRNTMVRFMTDLAEATQQSEAFFIAVGTPQSAGWRRRSLLRRSRRHAKSPAPSPATRSSSKKHRSRLHQRVDRLPTGAQRRRLSPLRCRLQSRVPSRGNCRRRLPSS